MKAVSSAIIALAGAVCMHAAQSGTARAFDRDALMMGSLLLTLIGAVTWIVTVRRPQP